MSFDDAVTLSAREFLHCVAIFIEPVELSGLLTAKGCRILSKDVFRRQLLEAPNIKLAFVVKCRAEISPERDLA